MEKTTVQINQETLNRLKSLKRYERESYDEIVNSLIDETEESLTNDEIEEIQKALEEVKRGQTYAIEDVAKKLRVNLK